MYSRYFVVKTSCKGIIAPTNKVIDTWYFKIEDYKIYNPPRAGL